MSSPKSESSVKDVEEKNKDTKENQAGKILLWDGPVENGFYKERNR
jgi:hypothetical protein